MWRTTTNNMPRESSSIIYKVFKISRNVFTKHQKLMLDVNKSRISKPRTPQEENSSALLTPLIYNNVLYIIKLANGMYRGYNLENGFTVHESRLEVFEDAATWLAELELDIGIEEVAWLSCIQWLFAVCDDILTEREALNYIKAVQEAGANLKLSIIRPINEKLGIATCTCQSNGDVLKLEVDSPILELGYIQFASTEVKPWDGPRISRSSVDVEKLVHRANTRSTAGRQAFVQLVNLYASNHNDTSLKMVKPTNMLAHYADVVKSTNSKTTSDLFKGTRFLSPFIAESKFMIADFDNVCKAVLVKHKSSLGRTSECLDYLEWLFLHPRYPEAVPKRLITLLSVLLGYKTNLERVFSLIARMSSHPIFRRGSLQKGFVNTLERAASISKAWNSEECTRSIIQAISHLPPQAVSPLLVQFLSITVANPPLKTEKYKPAPLFTPKPPGEMTQYIIIESRIVLHSVLPYVHNASLDMKKLLLDAALGILKQDVAHQDAFLNSMFYICAFILLTMGVDRQLISHASQVYIELMLDKRVNRAISGYKSKIYDITLPPDMINSVAKLINIQNLRAWPQLATVGCSKHIPDLKISCLPHTKDRDQLILDGIHSAFLKASHGSLANVFEFINQCQPLRRVHLQTVLGYMYTFYRHPRTKQSGIALALMLKSYYVFKFSSARLTAELATHKCGLPPVINGQPRIWYLIQFHGDFGCITRNLVVYSGHVDETLADTFRKLSNEFHAPCTLYPEKPTDSTHLLIMRLYNLDDQLVHLHYARKTTVKVDMQTVSPPQFYFPQTCESEILSASKIMSLKLRICRQELEFLHHLGYSDRLPEAVETTKKLMEEAFNIMSLEVETEVKVTQDLIDSF